MTATERAKRSDALYYETVSVTRRVLCDMIANREADLDDLREENAKLREERDMYSDLVGMMDHPDLNAQLQAENAKLRELAQSLITSHNRMCTQRGNCFSCVFFRDDDRACDFVKASQSLRKLGIEAVE